MNQIDEMIAVIRGILKALAFFAMILLLVPVALAFKHVKTNNPYVFPKYFHTTLLRLLGIKLRIWGAPSTDIPVLFVANHASYLDIPVLGSILSASFVAKSEVAGWPLFGFLARVQNTIFVERRSTRAAEQRTQLQTHLAKKQSLILFPEGTSSDGMNALPFKSSLFSIVENTAQDITITVQPVSVTCTEIDGFPMRREERPLYAWYGDMTMPPHLWEVFKNGHFTVDVIFHAPIAMADCPNRKVLAATCQKSIARGIERSLTGRPTAEFPLLTAKI